MILNTYSKMVSTHNYFEYFSNKTDVTDSDEIIKFSNQCCICCMNYFNYGDYIYFNKFDIKPQPHHGIYINDYILL